MLAVPSLLLRALGLGLLAWLPVRHRVGPAGLAGCLALGWLVDYGLVLAFGSLALAAWVGWALAAIGGVLGARALARSGRRAIPRPRSRWLAGAALLLGVGLVGVRALGEPLQNWDARSIWFFHAKIVYFDDGLREDSGWAELQFSHPDYPKLLPVLAAQVARTAGYWNETLPKAALIFLLLPAALASLRLTRGPAAGLFLFAVLFGRPHALLWNGQADALLALYGALAALALARALEERRSADLALALSLLGLACNLKNEGLLLLLCLALAAGMQALAQRSPWPGGSTWRSSGWLLALALVPLLWWRAKAWSWGLASDLELSPASLGRAAERLADGASAGQVVRAILVGQGFGALLLALAAALIACRGLRVAVPREAALPLLAASLYLAGLASIYLATPRELAWHLATSAHRTPLPAVLLTAAAVFRVLDSLESAPRIRSQ